MANEEFRRRLAEKIMNGDFDPGAESEKASAWFLPVSLILSTSNIMLRGFVLVYLWGWFVVPLGVSPIPWVLAMGIQLTVTFLTARISTLTEQYTRTRMSRSAEAEYDIKRGLVGLLYALIGWGIGALIHMGM